LDLNVLIRGQSNALLFAARGGADALEQGLEAKLGVDVHMLYRWDADASTIHSATAFMDWDTGGQQASLLRFMNGLSPDLKGNPTATLWLHNEYDQKIAGLATDAWVEEVKADATLVRGALGQGPATTPYEFVPIRYPYGGSFDAIKDGMARLDVDPDFNASVSWAAWSLTMDGDGYANSSHMGDNDAKRLGADLAAPMADLLRPLAGGSTPPPPTTALPPPATGAGVGTPGRDNLRGTNAGETFTPGAGNDTVRTGGGNDVVVFREGDDVDQIADFTRGSDRVQLNLSAGSDHVDNFAELQSLLAGGQIGVSSERNEITLSFGDGDSLTLVGVNDLAAQDWLFTG
jgi:hypothetical protein